MSEITLNIRLSDSSTFEIKFEADPTNFTIAELKRVIEPKATPPCPPEQQKLVYKGRILKDADTLELHGSCAGRGFVRRADRECRLAFPRTLPPSAHRAAGATSSEASAGRQEND